MNNTINYKINKKTNKLIIMSKIGYNHPSQANWSYGIWKIDTIDKDNDYQMSHIVKETFGGDSRFNEALRKIGIKTMESKGVYTNTGTPKITGISTLPDIESKEFIDQIIEWYNK